MLWSISLAGLQRFEPINTKIADRHVVVIVETSSTCSLSI